MVLFAKRRLFGAVQGGDTVKLGALLARGVDPNLRDADGDTPLITAARRDNPTHVRMLLDAGAGDRDAALRSAAYWGRNMIVETLIQAGGCDLSAALAEAAQGGRTGTVELLLNAGAEDPRGDALGSDALGSAAERSGFETARRLLERIDYDLSALASARDRDPAGTYGDVHRHLQQIITHRRLIKSSDAARALFERGPADPVSMAVFRWLRDHEGQTVYVTHESRADGARSPPEGGRWCVAPPLTEEPDGGIVLSWQLDDVRNNLALRLPAATYHEAEARSDALDYRLGFRLNFEGFEFATPEKQQVDRWYSYAFRT